MWGDAGISTQYVALLLPRAPRWSPATGGFTRGGSQCNSPRPRDGRNRMGATLGTRILTWLRGELVGSDAYGNRYYRLKGDKPQRLGAGRFSRERRWVIYHGEPQGSNVPPGLHDWL